MEKKKAEFNFLRKIWHLLGLVIPLGLFLDVFAGFGDYEHATRAIIVTILAFSLVVLALLEFFRFRYEGFSDLFWKIFGPLMKEGERENLNATLPYFIANLVVILLFPPELAVLSLSFLVIGDPFAAFMGSKYGKHRLYNGKSVEGIVAFILSSSVFGLVLVVLFSVFSSDTRFGFWLESGGVNCLFLIVLFLGSLIAGATEFFSGTTWKGLLDDNLLIPIISCFSMGVLASLLMDISWNEILFSVGELYKTS